MVLTNKVRTFNGLTFNKLEIWTARIRQNVLKTLITLIKWYVWLINKITIKYVIVYAFQNVTRNSSFALAIAISVQCSKRYLGTVQFTIQENVGRKSNIFRQEIMHSLLNMVVYTHNSIT